MLFKKTGQVILVGLFHRCYSLDVTIFRSA